MSDGLSNAFTISATFVTLAVIVTDRSEKRPGNLVRIQLITALGGWTEIAARAADELAVIAGRPGAAS